jgi:hypothetical protein
MVLPHLACVIAVMGMTRFMAAAVVECLNPINDFDGLLGSMDARLVSAFSNYAGSCSPTEVEEAQRVLLVGFSPVRNRVVGRLYTQITRASGFDFLDITGSLATPWESTWGLPDVSDATKMEASARRQCAYIRSEEPKKAAGGRLVLAQVLRDNVEIKIGAVLSEPEKLAGAPGVRSLHHGLPMLNVSHNASR